MTARFASGHTGRLLKGRPFSVAAITVRDGKIVELDFLAEPEQRRLFDRTIFD